MYIYHLLVNLFQILFDVLEGKNATHHINLVNEVADTLVNLGHYDLALKYYMMVEGIDGSHQVANLSPFSFFFFWFKDAILTTFKQRVDFACSIFLQGALHLRIAQCYVSLNDRLQAIIFYQKGKYLFSIVNLILFCFVLVPKLLLFFF